MQERSLDIYKTESRNAAVLANNLKIFFDRYCTDEDICAGLSWYRIANLQARKIADIYRLDIRTAAALIAVLSPANNWETNLSDTYLVLRSYAAGIAAEDVKASTYGPNVLKAYAIIDAVPRRAFKLIGKGPKTRSFYLNIMYPNRRTSVTVDRHAIGAALLCPTSAHQGLSVTAARYRDIAAAYVSASVYASHSIGGTFRDALLPHEFQAIVWTAYRREFTAVNTETETAPF